MIVPMKKISLVVLENTRVEALSALRKLGVVHVEKREASSQILTSLQDSLLRVKQAETLLSELKVKAPVSSSKNAGREETSGIVDKILELKEQKNRLFETVTRLSRELDRLEKWGPVNPADFEYLSEQGIFLFPFEMSSEDFASLADSVRTITLSRNKKNVRCVIWSDVNLLPYSLPSSALPLVMPEKSTAEMKAEKEAAEKLLPEIDARLADFLPYMKSLEELEKTLLKEIEFEVVRAGMPEISFSDGNESGDSAPAAVPKLAWLSGFVPCDKLSMVLEAASENGWACVADDPSGEDNVPTLLKNNRLVNLISPLMDFLGTVPGYREIDISLWFLFFFGVFFAMIFGDGGYGVLLTVISIAGILKTSGKGKKTPTALFMMLYLSLMTVAWGTVTCTWFSLPPEQLPGFLRAIAVPAFSSENPAAQDNIKVFCFVLALIQLSLAHIVCIFRNIKSPKFLGDLGSLMMVVGMFFVVLNLVVDAEKYPINNLVLGGIGAGFLLNFIFTNYEGNLGKGILTSLQNIISMLLGVVNVFGDIMSYIRLWAVGLAGSAISSTVNQMAGPMLGGFVIFIGILILFFGHGLNLIMNVLSVIVHGVRLNILEFSNHISLTWSGFKYEPFSETVGK